jgi:hypothetical protein
MRLNFNSSTVLLKDYGPAVSYLLHMLLKNTEYLYSFKKQVVKTHENTTAITIYVSSAKYLLA